MSVPILLTGLIAGLGYGALALGFVLVYRASRVVNLAHAEIGAAAAGVMALLVRDHGVPYAVGFPLAIVLGAAFAALTEAVIIRRLRQAPRAIVLVATVGVAQLFLGVSIATIGAIRHRAGGYPVPFVAHVGVGRVLVLQTGQLMTLALIPLAGLALAAFLRWSSLGAAVRATSENADAARLVGIPVGRVITLVWALSGGLSALTALVLLPGRPLIGTEALGPGVLLRALGAAVLARLTSLPRALAAAVGLGLVESWTLAHRPSGGEAELVVFAVILAGLLLQSWRRPTGEHGSSWLLTAPIRPLPRRVAARPVVRWGAPALALLLAAGAASVCLPLSNADTLTLTTVASYALVALSATVLIGVAGQVSLGQIGFFGLGAAVSYQLSVSVGIPFFAALLGAGAVGALGSVVLGLPALRLRGLLFAVTTLGFALVAQSWLLAQPWLAGAGVHAPRPYVGSIDLAGQRPYYVFTVGIVTVAALLVRRLLRSGVGRRMVAVRDNEPAAAAWAIPPARTKLVAFAVAGFLAGLAGALYGHGLQQFGVSDFPVANAGLQAHAVDSLQVVAMAVIGGLGSIPGALLGAVFVAGADRFAPTPALKLLTTSSGLLLLLLFAPGGMAAGLARLRDWLARLLPVRAGPAAPPLPPRAGTGTGRSIELDSVTVTYGGLRALDEVTLAVPAGSVTGLVGANGAGKSTWLAVASGHLQPRTGRVSVGDVDVTALGPVARSRRYGIIRSFQDPRLFQGLTVSGALLLATERTAPTRLAGAFLGGPGYRRQERARWAEAEALIGAFGLEPFSDVLVGDLSQGQRRAVDLACAVALQPSVLLLDEPSSGLAQPEAAALGPVLARVRALTGATVVVVEHDLALAHALCDRIVGLEAGRVVSQAVLALAR